MIYTVSTLLQSARSCKICLIVLTPKDDGPTFRPFQGVRRRARDSHGNSRMGKQRTIFLWHARSSRITRRILARGKCIRGG